VAESPAARNATTVLPGDVLTHVNGQAVAPNANRELYFSQPSLDEELALRFRRGGESVEIKLRPQSYFAIRDLVYNEWEAECQRRVDERSNKRIAYVHMKDMGMGELNRFLREMVSEGAYRDGLILDLRWNTGGNVHDEVLRFLSQRPYLQWKYREGQLTTQSNFGPAAKPMVLLINEQSLSDAEMTAEGFKALKLGKVIGTETYRWIIFTSGKTLVDGSFYRLPSWGCYTLDGKNLEKTGVAPDISIKNTFKDRLDGKDPQLDRAIEEV
jgi:tricorn protease